jgi:Domain of unknown function (DUF6321)
MPNVNGNPPPATNDKHEHSIAARAIKDFNTKHGEILRAHRAGEAIHPSHVEAYERARGNLSIPSGFDSRLVPPSINFASRSKGTQQATMADGGQTQERTIDYKAMKPKQEERVLNYAEMNKPKHKEPERTFTYGKDGSVTETVNPNAPDFKAPKPAMKSLAALKERMVKSDNWPAKASLDKSDKPFHGYNPKRHARSGGLNDKAREKMNREEGSNLKRPVTEKNPGPKAAARRRSFCARMSGVSGPTSKDGKLTPKGAALKRWRCSKSMGILEDFQKSPGLKQGSKLGREVYDETNWSGHKQTRTGSGNMIGTKNEQVYGGKARHQTAKDTARSQEKIDQKKNKKQPVKTEISPELKAELEAKANMKKSLLAKAVSALQKRCWKGYEPTPGKEAYSEGSCQPVEKSQMEHPHDQGDKPMALKSLLDMKRAIEMLEQSIDSNKDLPDWMEAKLTEAALLVNQASSYQEFEATEKSWEDSDPQASKLEARKDAYKAREASKPKQEEEEPGLVFDRPAMPEEQPKKRSPLAKARELLSKKAKLHILAD